MPIQLIVGLGNPGDNYTKTRHNAGFWFLDRLSSNFRYNKKFNAEFAEISVAGQKIYLLKPLTFMNRSGDAVQKAMQFYKIPPESVLVAHDELDFPVGICKFKQGGGHGGHNGLRDIIGKIGSSNFLRLRIGIDHPRNAGQVVDYVLKMPSKADLHNIENGLTDAERAIDILIKDGSEAAMLTLHSNE
ncbi:MAG: aminoacyl-tRNA hydrolase [Gammaproteobacteria bacterium]|nr:MAG: aminoacyl-tRNA hydrolase [Gammaproteobacteria bacterium]